MDDKRRAEKKLFAGEKKVSMKRRDDYNDYRGRRMYMITMEVEGRKPVFGTLKGDIGAALNSSEAPHIELPPLGRTVSEEWMGIPRYYPQVEVMGLQMMPDHLHGILFVHETLPVHLSQVIIGFKTGCNRILHNMQGKTAAQPLRPFFDLHIGSYTYNGIGNRRLLLTSQRKAVRISRRVTITEKDLA